ncbi:MAG TPA: hypothetical protein LFW14_03160 [Rickettsia endosymbiont of Degeeriella rufa]|nr:hypothetical protein [Rickettsia endosymbiont of Degeeriella rufa]
MPIQHKMPEQKWQIFVRALDAKGIEVESVTDSKVIFKISAEDLEHLRNLLDDKEALKKNVIHALFNSERNNVEKLEEYTYDADILDKDMSKLLNKIVSPKFIQKNNIDNILDKLRIEFDEKLLVSKGKLSFKNPIKKDIKEATLKLLQATIKDEKSLSKILVNEEDITPFQKAVYPPTDFSQLITQISSNEENSLNFIMNNGAIAQSV